jgi:uncharacterized protein
MKNPISLSRRNFIRLAAASLVPATGLAVYTWKVEPHWLVVRHESLPIAHAPVQWQGRRIVHISDLHIGTLVSTEHLLHAMEAVNALRPDMILITGDLMSQRDGFFPAEDIQRVYGSLKLPAHGIHTILGNHDYGGAHLNSKEVAANVTQMVRGLGITVLRNEALERGGLTIIGLDDLWCHEFRPDLVSDVLNAPGAKLAMVHNPDACDGDGWGSYQGPIFSGHTHGGQCKSPFLPPLILPVQNKRYTTGRIDLEDGRVLHINPGLGYVRKLRFNVRPEITVYTVAMA